LYSHVVVAALVAAGVGAFGGGGVRMQVPHDLSGGTLPNFRMSPVVGARCGHLRGACSGLAPAGVASAVVEINAASTTQTAMKTRLITVFPQ
jgi:hypothetical protein